MSPILNSLGGLAARAFGFGSAPTAAPFTPSGAYDALASVSVISTVSSIVFAGIPSGYRHLQIRALTVSNAPSSGVSMQFNGDSSSSYKGHGVYGAGSGTANYTVTSPIYAPNFGGGAKTASPGAAIIDILDYASTTKNKTIISLDGYDANGSGYVGESSGVWFSNSAITSITLLLSSFTDGAQYALYGVK